MTTASHPSPPTKKLPTLQQTNQFVLDAIQLTRRAMDAAEQAIRDDFTDEAWRAFNAAAESVNLGQNAVNVHEQVLQIRARRTRG